MRAVERRLRDRIKSLEKELIEVKADRDGFRATMTYLLRRVIELHGKGHYWSSSSLIETLSQHIAKREWWYW